MKKPLLPRLCAAVLILTFVVGLPMQGTAMAVSALVAPVPWAGEAEIPTPDGCDRCGNAPAMTMLCPTVFCIGLTAVVVEARELERVPPNTLLNRGPASRVGRSLSPDPYPPRTSFHS